MMAVPLREMPYQTLGDLFLDFGTNAVPVENYRRDLDLDTAVASVSYTANGVHFQREIFSSPVDQVIVIHLTADKPGQISFTAGMTTLQKATVTNVNLRTLVMNGINGALKFQARVRLENTGGTVSASGDRLMVDGADFVTLLIAAATSCRNGCRTLTCNRTSCVTVTSRIFTRFIRARRLT